MSFVQWHLWEQLLMLSVQTKLRRTDRQTAEPISSGGEYSKLSNVNISDSGQE